MKEYNSSIRLDEVWNHFEGFPLSHLATVEGDQPRVRMMTLVAHEGRLWMATKTEWNKVDQIAKNSRIEISVPARDESGSGCLRVTGKAHLIRDPAVRAELAKVIPWFSSYWDSHEDRNFSLLRFEIHRVLFDHPSNGLKYEVDLG
jgi:general stress protein 26